MGTRGGTEGIGEWAEASVGGAEEEEVVVVAVSLISALPG